MNIPFISNIPFEKLKRYCAYQERCHLEVHEKLKSLQIFGSERDQIIGKLIEENFLNEERFARAFARGKFRIKGWGKIKIRNELKKRNISSYCIKVAMEEIDSTDYREKIALFIQKKEKALNEKNRIKKNQMILKSSIARGYEPEMVMEILKELV